MENIDLEENIKAKEKELAKIVDFEQTPLYLTPTANFNFQSNFPQWPTDGFNENFGNQIPVQNLGLQLSQLHIDVPNNYTNLPQRMFSTTSFDPRDFVLGNKQNFEFPDKKYSGLRLKEARSSYNPQYQRGRRSHYHDRPQNHHKRRQNRNHRGEFVVDEQELENIEIDLSELELRFQQTTEEDILNDFWRLYTYLDGISQERKNILKILASSKFVHGETYVPKRILTIKQSHEYATNCISLELEMVSSALKVIKHYYGSELEDLIETADSSLVKVKSSMNNFHSAAHSTIQDCNPNHRARDLNSKFEYLENALSDATLYVRELATSMYMLTHFVTCLSEANVGVSTRNIFHGS